MDTKYKCWVCSRLCISGEGRMQHFLSHLNRRPYLCMDCRERFEHPGDLRQHMVSRHPSASSSDKSTPFECHLCSKQFKNAEQVKKHRLQTHDRLLRKSDEDQDRRSPAQEQDLASKEEPPKNKPRTQHHSRKERAKAADGKFECKQCGKRFNSATVLNYHSMYH